MFQPVTTESEPLPVSLVVAGGEGWCSLIEVGGYICKSNEKTRLASTAGRFQENVVFRAWHLLVQKPNVCTVQGDLERQMKEEKE